MKIGVIAFLLTLFSSMSNAQTRYYLRFDTVYVLSGTNGELVLQNSTRNKTGGVLKNVGNGRTKFAYVVDSSWISNDTIFLSRGDGTIKLKLPSADLDKLLIEKTVVTPEDWETPGDSIRVRLAFLDDAVTDNVQSTTSMAYLPEGAPVSDSMVQNVDYYEWKTEFYTNNGGLRSSHSMTGGGYQVNASTADGAFTNLSLTSYSNGLQTYHNGYTSGHVLQAIDGNKNSTFYKLFVKNTGGAFDGNQILMNIDSTTVSKPMHFNGGAKFRNLTGGTVGKYLALDASKNLIEVNAPTTPDTITVRAIRNSGLNNIEFVTGPNRRMYLNNAGQLLINTTNDGGSLNKLAVGGGIYATGPVAASSVSGTTISGITGGFNNNQGDYLNLNGDKIYSHYFFSSGAQKKNTIRFGEWSNSENTDLVISSHYDDNLGNITTNTLTLNQQGLDVSSPVIFNHVSGFPFKVGVQYSPTSTYDPVGHTGNVSFDNEFIYYKTSTGWKRTQLFEF